MQIDIYSRVFNSYFSDPDFKKILFKAVKILKSKKRIFFIGNGGSNSISSHMMEDYGKIARYETFSFSDPALITCFANDYGYENAITEWLKIHLKTKDLLIALSSSGNSKNIINAVNFAKKIGASIITLSGFNATNPLKNKGNINFHIPINNYGVVECFHQIILHAILDELALLRS